ncbi:MAG: chloramphenicol acetyltransferase [Burkholderiales bacterium PBB4]|nr:MAG: chloramphenicol acetyltransferase [Burkholderiales bacterium PBB4]
MKRPIDLATWNRREHFEFFSAMDEPFHGLVVNLDCTATYVHCRAKKQAFFLTYLHKILCAVNATAPMRQRIEAGKPVEFDAVHCNVTVARPDGTFGFCSIDFDADFSRFVAVAQVAMARVRESTGLGLKGTTVRSNEIHFSALPGVRFTGLTHARSYGGYGAEPKISVGQIFQDQGRWWMPVAVFVHHGLVDGQHVADFLARTQTLFDAP